ncbi:hypothetical protein OSB04_010264 [Centaurea solstitialis]|uniref:Uncharacterized protein n=1 Tax=Centaurea solstitialis TaxID=347529 RepID=A0AA38WKH0_9ASTR|nr:hypothetical protein OSB04_010264 [Centaurea solstitialis]
MSSNRPWIRARGQRSIPSTFIINRTSIDEQLSDGREDSENAKKRSKISLSDFLDRKLQKTSDPSKLVQGKERQFLSPGTSVGAKRSIGGANADEKTEGRELNGILDVVLGQFKQNKENEDNSCFNPESEVENNTSIPVTEESQMKDLSKGRNAFGGFHGKQPAPKRLVVLGDDPKPKQTKRPKSFIRKEKPLPLYNHYASGSGWWDDDMEGIDNEAVGFNEVWEGVGTATMGGLDWH